MGPKKWFGETGGTLKRMEPIRTLEEIGQDSITVLLGDQHFRSILCFGFSQIVKTIRRDDGSRGRAGLLGVWGENGPLRRCWYPMFAHLACKLKPSNFGIGN
jgi:hypothetical protein